MVNRRGLPPLFYPRESWVELSVHISHKQMFTSPWFRHLPSIGSPERWQKDNQSSVHHLPNTVHLIFTTTQWGSWRLLIPILWVRSRELKWRSRLYSQLSGRVNNWLDLNRCSTEGHSELEPEVTPGAFAQQTRPKWSVTASTDPRVDVSPPLISYTCQCPLCFVWDSHVAHSVPGTICRTLLLLITYKNNFHDIEEEFIEKALRTMIGRLS